MNLNTKSKRTQCLISDLVNKFYFSETALWISPAVHITTKLGSPYRIKLNAEGVFLWTSSDEPSSTFTAERSSAVRHEKTQEACITYEFWLFGCITQVNKHTRPVELCVCKTWAARPDVSPALRRSRAVKHTQVLRKCVI